MSKEIILNEGCPQRKCFLSECHPNSDAGLACDMDCYFKKGEEGEKNLDYYISKYSKIFENLFVKSKT